METSVPPKCPACGRLTLDNRRHCKPDDQPGNVEFWSKHCLVMQCTCGVLYGTHGYTPRVTTT